MHVIFRESHGLEDGETPVDLGQCPGDLVVLSFSDSDLGAFSAGWHRANGSLPTLRLANLIGLKHPLSVDTYIAQTLGGAKGILIRLIGGVPYWSYGLQQVAEVARARGIALAVVPADGREDPRLDEMSTLPVSTLRQLSKLCDAGGAVAAQAALAQLALAAGLYAAPVSGAKSLPAFGAWTRTDGLLTEPYLRTLIKEGGCLPPDADGVSPEGIVSKRKPRVCVVFYRSYLVAADMGAVDALLDGLHVEGFDAIGLFVPSLKATDAGAWLRDVLPELGPVAIVNATAFSGKVDGGASPLDSACVPVFQVALSNATEQAWCEADRGLSPADLAMHVVMPEVDGRLFAGVVSFKEPQPKDPDLQYARYMHRAAPDRVASVVRRVASWYRLSQMNKPRVVLVLSTYPGRTWNMAHAVGLDAVASADAIAEDLGLSAQAEPLSIEAIKGTQLQWPVEKYEAALAELPQALRDELEAAWGPVLASEDVVDSHITLPVLRHGDAWIALQPERGLPRRRDDEYHDLSRVPRHGYVAFYLWMQQHCDALIHIGAHGTLEWLPGKAVALSNACWPEALVGDVPCLYPFIVNDPGEAAQAKRRLGAMTLGHIPPPLRQSGTPDRLASLEALLDEFSNADGLDPKRRDRLMQSIRLEAQVLGVEADLGITSGSCEAEAITRIDRFVCDVKDSVFGDGLHVWGRVSGSEDVFDTKMSIASERAALPAALTGRRIDAGPAGSPHRGRSDVLPTGRNLFAVDPRAVPSRNAFAQGQAMATEVIRRHMQDEGDYLRHLVVDLWGSATMRTAGEEFAMALALMGVRPKWDAGSERVGGFDIVPIAELDHPRVDVTLRISGLFRDVFPNLPVLYGQAVKALAARDEAADWNPFVGLASSRVFGPQPGSYGAGLGPHLSEYGAEARQAAGEAWLKASSWSFDSGDAVQDADGIRARVAEAQSFVHVQDLAETDLLLSEDYASHEAGFAAAQSVTGGHANLVHLDTTDPRRPRARGLTEEIARVVQARAANPAWIAGMQRHGYRGAAEIATTLENMSAFAQLAGVVPDHLFDLYFETTLGQSDVVEFMEVANPEALAALRDRFAALHEAGLWTTRRNTTRAILEGAA
ncbi:MAG: cobaltochelatase subunit CobN [Marinovum sp.]|nr:cobaltochelatase subunit CobN [Marinovum sp.]